MRLLAGISAAGSVEKRGRLTKLRRLPKLAAALCIPFVLSGCVTMQGPTGIAKDLTLPFGLTTGGLTDMLSPQVREFKSLVGASKLAEADDYFNRNADYFEARYKDGLTPLPPEFAVLSEHVWKTRYQDKVLQATTALKAVTAIPERAGWPVLSAQVKAASIASATSSEDRLLRLAKQGVPQRELLNSELARIQAMARQEKPSAVLALSDDVLSTGSHQLSYVGDVNIEYADFVGSEPFQQLVVARLNSLTRLEDYQSRAKNLSEYLNPRSKEAVDRAYVELARRQLYADGRITLEEVGALSSAKPPFGTSAEALRSLVKIGYVDLTSASFKNRNVFDFEVAFNRDIELAFQPATEAIFTASNLSQYDFVFVTDLTMAKVSREFKSKSEVKSRFQSDTRQTPNPDYVGAMTRYQTAMAQYQRAQISSAIPKACQGWGCALQGLADGLENASARSQVEQASNSLASTPQTLTVPVYAEYAYQAVDINAQKTAQVNYYVIDVKAGRTLKNNFTVNDQETFNVAYNVHEKDPQSSSISRNLKNEKEVSDWEKRPVSVSLSSLFSPAGLKSATQEPFKNVQAFLQTLNTRTFAAAGPTYTTTATTPTSSTASAQTIADERFDSVVIVRNSKATGTGFYVTPDLILTAFHVVDGNSLVELTFHDGTKSYGRVVDHDIRLDLALVRAQTAGKPLKIHQGPLRLGETVEAIGHPKGYEFTITRGVISAVRKQRSATIASENLVEFIQTDTPISPGNSGGPLLLKDVVIGVNDWIRVDKGSQNLNFSVSFNEIRSYLDRFQGR
ncbi:MAG: trypsin-like peptidase domain-containing protein [Hydrogenophaga sp.]|uniref:S1C family serine protease n=1 Tax=Hydrogenophaga sp. TaxID=1904254 RepID=UPI002735A022|nr:trypsin-like peptidase domain-containing protein [Hydrogenophaga sp.]MDP3350247.1 trypsin-like peptidase domain-containing protein [Hydrogenophaga sp.]